MNHIKERTLLILFCFALLLAGCGGATAAPAAAPESAALQVEALPDPPDAPAAEIVEAAQVDEAAVRGRKIFELGGADELYEPKYACVTCHSLDGRDGDGPTLQGIAGRAGERVPELSAEEYIYQSIVDPYAYLVEGYGSTMSKVAGYLLSEEELDDLVAFLLTQTEAAPPSSN